MIELAHGKNFNLVRNAATLLAAKSSFRADAIAFDPHVMLAACAQAVRLAKARDDQASLSAIQTAKEVLEKNFMR